MVHQNTDHGITAPLRQTQPMLLEDAPPLAQLIFAIPLPVHDLLRIRVDRLMEASPFVELSPRIITSAARALNADLAMVVSAAETSDLPWSSALRDVLAGRAFEVAGSLGIGVALEVCDPADLCERIVGFCEMALLRTAFEAGIVDIRWGPEFDVELPTHRRELLVSPGSVSLESVLISGFVDWLQDD